MANLKIYDKTIINGENQLRIMADHSFVYIHINSNLLFAATHKKNTPFTQPFNIEINEKPINYIITFVLNPTAKCLISKNGWLIYSDDPDVKVCEVESVIDNLLPKE